MRLEDLKISLCVCVYIKTILFFIFKNFTVLILRILESFAHEVLTVYTVG